MEGIRRKFIKGKALTNVSISNNFIVNVSKFSNDPLIKNIVENTPVIRSNKIHKNNGNIHHRRVPSNSNIMMNNPNHLRNAYVGNTVKRKRGIIHKNIDNKSKILKENINPNEEILRHSLDVNKQIKMNSIMDVYKKEFLGKVP